MTTATENPTATGMASNIPTNDAQMTQDAAGGGNPALITIPLAPHVYTAEDIHPIGMPMKITMIPTDAIIADGSNNVRRYAVPAAKIEELAKDIVARGQLQPVIVQKHPTEKGKYKVIAGETRTRAIVFANLNLLPVNQAHLLVACSIVEMSDIEAFAAGYAENAKRTDMTAVDYANIVGRFKNTFNMSVASIAKAMGRMNSWVIDHAAILDLRASIQKKIALGTLPYTSVRELKSMSEEDQDAYITGVESGDTREAAKGKVKAKKRKKGQETAEAEAGEGGGTGEAAVKITLSLKETRTMLQNLAGVGGKDSDSDKACPYSDKVQNVAAYVLKAMDGKIGEKALSNKIDKA